MKNLLIALALVSFVAGCSDDDNSNNNTNNTNNINNANNINNINNINNLNNVTAEICDDFTDNDGDGATDCDDFDCAAAANCLLNNVNNVFNGVCDNPADIAIIDGAAVDQDAVTGTCTQSCFFNGDFLGCVTDCVQADTGLSAGCSACYGGTADCGKTNCMTACMGGASPACEACLDENCHPAFVTCAGLEGR
jgi:hypothetical protein